MVGRAIVSRVLSTISTKNARQRAARGIHAARRDVYVRVVAGAGWSPELWWGSWATPIERRSSYRTTFDTIEQCSIDAQVVMGCESWHPHGNGPRRRPTGPRRRASHSMEAVLTEAVALLDEAGEGALTFRALAARLGGGVGSIYWYVSSKDELLDRAADHVLADVLGDVEKLPGSDDPIDDMRAIALMLFDAIAERPWLGAYFLRDTGVQPNGLRLYELLGRRTLRLDLTRRERFHAVSAVIGYVVGIAADLGQQPPQVVLDGEVVPRRVPRPVRRPVAGARRRGVPVHAPHRRRVRGARRRRPVRRGSRPVAGRAPPPG